MLERTADELADLLEAMQPAAKDEDWRARTEMLVQSIASEIGRMVEFSSSNNHLKTETKEDTGSSHSTIDLSRRARESAFDCDDADSLMSYLSNMHYGHSESSDLASRQAKAQNKDVRYSQRSKSGVNKSGNSTKDTHLTPFEVWKAARWRQVESEPVKELSKKQIKELSTRLYEHHVKQDIARQRAQDEALVEELSSLDFKPKINNRSKKLARVRPIQERLYNIIEKREEKLAQERERLAQEEIADCQSTPTINRTNRWKPRVSRRYADASLEQADVSTHELTFAPKVNVRSLRLADRACEEGRRQSIEKAKIHRRNSRDSVPEHLSFHPQINDRSKKIGRRGSVHERLYNLSTISQSARPQTDVNLNEEPRSATSAAGKQRCPSPVFKLAPNKESSVLNEVVYNATKHDFILERLRQMGDNV